jgi:hypothetical protein
MSYSERAYFEGDACHHCAARDEHLRLVRLRKAAATAHRMNDRRRNGRRGF